ncbi:uncharacterized protein GGS22DRAFT_192232 [Annulohypoxylon maeteangense]|uniref:uncharacterized protein n=1 Tax=Annulohypoxylon maeteangense TaxID=1927788 RepID=UPI002007C60C|nr:uncharacterized protein GGS22DRAFT_192232 [Annulohypoxylon maeteangense]KAI0881596.1 hypothetical protein GGS22DRAFT_192232 [Annulohypoxylon maeteangense]
MSTKATPTAPKPSEGGQSTKAWTSDDSLKVMLLIMQHENPNLGVSGWKAIGDKAQVLFGGKYTMVAVKQQFQRLRRNFMEEIPEGWKEKAETGADKAGGDAGEEGGEVSGKGKKRAAPATDDPTANALKAKKARVAKKVTKGPAKNAKNDIADDSEGEQRQIAKNMAPRRGAKKSQPVGRVTHDNMAATETQSGDDVGVVDSHDNAHASTSVQPVAADPVADDPVAMGGFVGDNDTIYAVGNAQVTTPSP